MKIDYKQVGQVIYASLYGELDEYSSGTVREALDNLIAKKRFNSMVIDFKGVSFMDSTGVGIVLGRYKKLKKNNQILTLKGANHSVLKVFKTCGLQEIIEV